MERSAQRCLEKHAPQKATELLAFIKSLLHRKPLLKPAPANLEMRLREAMFWAEPAKILLIKASGLSSMTHDEQSAYSFALLDTTRMVKLISRPAELPIEIITLLMRAVIRQADRLESELANVDEIYREPIVETFEQILSDVLLVSAELIRTERTKELAVVQRYLDVCLSGCIPIGIDATTNTAVVIVGD